MEEVEHIRPGARASLDRVVSGQLHEEIESLRLSVLRETARRLVSAPTDLVRKRRRAIKKDITRKNANLWISPRPIDLVLHYPVILGVIALAGSALVWSGVQSGLSKHPQLGWVERYRHFRFVPLAMASGSIADSPGIRDFVVMRGGCSLEPELVSAEQAGNTLVKTYASELDIDGLQVVLPPPESAEPVAVSFRVEGSHDLAEWAAVGSSSWRHTDSLKWVALDGRIEPSAADDLVHTLDMRPPVAWWLWCCPLKLAHALPLLVSVVLVLLRAKHASVALLVAMGVHGFGSLALGITLLVEAESAYALVALVVAGADVVFFAAMATERLIVPAALASIVITLADVVRFTLIYRQPQYLPGEMRWGGFVVCVFGVWGHRMKTRLVREAVEAIKFDMDSYRAAWKECLAREDQSKVVQEAEVLTKTIRACLHKNERPRHLIPIKHSNHSSHSAGNLPIPLPSLTAPVQSKAAGLLRSVGGFLHARLRRSSIESQESGSVGPSSVSSGQDGHDERYVPVTDLDQVFLQARAVDPIFRRKVWEWARQAGGMLPVRRGQEEEAGGGAESKRTGRRRSTESQSSANGGEQVVFEAAETLASMEAVAWAEVKGIDRAIEKTQRVYRGNPSRLVDVCRQRVVFERAEGLVRMLRVLLCDSIAVVRGVKNGMTSKKRGKKAERRHLAGFRAITISVSLASPDAVPVCLHCCELQLVLLPIAQVQLACNHDAYLFFRNAEAVRENSLATWIRRHLLCQDSTRAASAFLSTVGVEEDEAGSEPPSRRASRVGSFMAFGSFAGVGSMTDFAAMFNRSFTGSVRNFGVGGSVLNRRARQKVHPADASQIQSPHASIKWRNRRISAVTAAAAPTTIRGPSDRSMKSTDGVSEAPTRLSSGGSDASNQSHRSRTTRRTESEVAGRSGSTDVSPGVLPAVNRVLPPAPSHCHHPAAAHEHLELPPEAPAPATPQAEVPSHEEGLDGATPRRTPTPEPHAGSAGSEDEEEMVHSDPCGHKAAGETADPVEGREVEGDGPSAGESDEEPVMVRSRLCLQERGGNSLRLPPELEDVLLPGAVEASELRSSSPTLLASVMVPLASPKGNRSSDSLDSGRAPLELPNLLESPVSRSKAVDDMRLKSQAMLRLRRMAGAKVSAMVRTRLERERSRADAAPPAAKDGLEDTLSRVFAEAMTHPAGRLDKMVKKEHHRAMRGASVVSAFFTSQPLATALGFRRVRSTLVLVALLLVLGAVRPLQQLAMPGTRTLSQVRFELLPRAGPGQVQISEGRLLLYGCESEAPTVQEDQAGGVLFGWDEEREAHGWRVAVRAPQGHVYGPSVLSAWGRRLDEDEDEAEGEDGDEEEVREDEVCLVPYWKRAPGHECAVGLGAAAPSGSEQLVSVELRPTAEHSLWAVTPLGSAVGIAIAVAQAHRRKEGLAKHTMLVTNLLVAVFLLACVLVFALADAQHTERDTIFAWSIHAAACAAMAVATRLTERRLVVMQGCLSALQLLLKARYYWQDEPSGYLALALAGDAGVVCACVCLLLLRELVLRRSSRLIREDQRTYDAMWRQIVADDAAADLQKLSELAAAVTATIPSAGQVRQRCSGPPRGLDGEQRGLSLGAAAMQLQLSAVSVASALPYKSVTPPRSASFASSARTSQDPAVTDAPALGRSTSGESSASGQEEPGGRGGAEGAGSGVGGAGWPVRSLDQVLWQAKVMHFVLKDKCKEWAAASQGMVRSVNGKLALWSEVARSPALAATCKWCDVKSSERAIEKQLRSYGRDPSRLLDVCRQALVFASVADLCQCLQVLAADASVRIVRLKNRLDPAYSSERSAGYRDLAVNLQISTPVTHSLDVHLHVCELQLILKHFAELKSNDGHKRYVQFRNARGE